MILKKSFSTTLLLILISCPYVYASNNQAANNDVATFQSKVHNTLAYYQKKLGVDEIVAVVMKSDTGELLTVDSSNAVTPYKSIQQMSQSNAIKYTYSPSKVLFPVIFALNYDIFNPIGTKVSLDFFTGSKVTNTAIDRLRDDVSNEAWVKSQSEVQMTKKLTPMDIHLGLLKFGYSQPIGLSEKDTKLGSMISLIDMENPNRRATIPLGYGVQASLMQNVKAYSVFNNDGDMVNPRLYGVAVKKDEKRQVINASTSYFIFAHLQNKVKNDFTDFNASGFQISGYRNLSVNNDDLKKTHATFIVNIDDGKNKFTIGVSAFNLKNPEEQGSAWLIGVVREIIKAMVE